MYIGSTEFNNLIEKSGGNALITRFKFSNFSIEKFTKLEYYGGSNSSDDIAIGTTNMAYLDVSTITDKLITNREFLLEVGMELSDGTVEYAPMGYFTVQKPDGDEDTVNFKAYDRMQKFEKPYVSSLAYPTDSSQILNELCAACGVELATPIINPIAITDKLDGYTCREILGYIAGIHGFFACFDRYGKLNLRWYSETPIEKQIGLIWALTKSQSNYKVEKITLAKNTETTYTSGTGISGINHSNPYATQGIADSIYAKLNGFTYRPCEISMLDDIRLDPWDMLKVTYLDGSVLTIPVMALEHSFTSGETRVKSFGKTDTENEYNYSGPVTQAMDRMATELLVANRIIATKVDAEWVNAHTATIAELEATNARVGTLETSKLNASDLSAEVAKLGYATVDNLNATNAKIQDLDVNKLSVADAKVQYAEIDFSNVGTQVVSTSMIKDGAVTNEKVGNLSANKITSGTIDASKITVTNLNADNLTVGTINGKLIGNGSVDLDKLSQEVPTKEYLDSVQKDLQGQIDGAIETFTKSEIPTLNNEPANAWTDNETRKKHIGDVCYVLNPASSADGYCYRFANTGTEASPQYEWVLIKDSDVTKALQDIIDINGEITGIKQFDNEISSWKTDTDNELSSIKARTSTLETEMGTKVESTTFNTLKQTVDENSSNITSLSTTVSKKADSSTVTALTNTVNSVKQTADTNTSSISSMQTTISKKADSSTVTALSNKTSELEHSLNGFKTTVSDTYATKTALNTVDGKFANYSTTAQMNSAIQQKANEINLSVSANYTTKSEFNNLQVGGRNYFSSKKQTAFDKNNECRLNDYQNKGSLTQFYNLTVPMSYFVGKNCKLSFDVISPNGNTPLAIYNNNGNARYLMTFTNISSIGTTWTHQELTITVTDRGESYNEITSNKIEFYCSQQLGCKIRNVKFEIGNKATDWTPAPEDVDEKIDGLVFDNRNYVARTNSVVGWINAYGELINGSTWDKKFRTTDYISVSPGEQYTLQLWWTAGESEAWYVYSFWDSNKAIVSVSPAEVHDYNGYFTTTFTIPNGVYYVRVSWFDLTGFKVKLEKGTKATDWSPAVDDNATKAELSLKVGKDDNDQIVSMLNASADEINLKANRFSLESTNATITKTGVVNFKSGTIGGFTLSGGTLSSSATDYLLPDSYVLEDIKQHYLNGEPYTTKYDFNNDGVIDLFDMLHAKNYRDGINTKEQFKNWQYAESSEVNFAINPNNPTKAISITATDMWGRNRNTYIGIDGIETDKVTTADLIVNKDFAITGVFGIDPQTDVAHFNKELSISKDLLVKGNNVLTEKVMSVTTLLNSYMAYDTSYSLSNSVEDYRWLLFRHQYTESSASYTNNKYFLVPTTLMKYSNGYTINLDAISENSNYYITLRGYLTNSTTWKCVSLSESGGWHSSYLFIYGIN